jgi:hypothetical protein
MSYFPRWELLKLQCMGQIRGFGAQIHSAKVQVRCKGMVVEDKRGQVQQGGRGGSWGYCRDLGMQVSGVARTVG